MTPLTDRSKAAPSGFDIFVCACRRLPTCSGCSPRTTCVSALPRAAAPRARSPPAPLLPCAQSPSSFAAAAVETAAHAVNLQLRDGRICGPAAGRWRPGTRDEAQGFGTQFSQHWLRSGRASATAFWAGCLGGHVGPGWWCLPTARLSPPLTAVSAPEMAGSMHGCKGVCVRSVDARGQRRCTPCRSRRRSQGKWAAVGRGKARVRSS